MTASVLDSDGVPVLGGDPVQVIVSARDSGVFPIQEGDPAPAGDSMPQGDPAPAGDSVQRDDPERKGVPALVGDPSSKDDPGRVDDSVLQGDPGLEGGSNRAYVLASTDVLEPGSGRVRASGRGRAGVPGLGSAQGRVDGRDDRGAGW